MKHYVIPTKKEEPNIIILHAGTNNLRDNQSTTSLANTAILTWIFEMYFFNLSDVDFLFCNLIMSICILILIGLHVLKS